MSKIKTRKKYYREEYNSTHTSGFIKGEILNVIHRQGCHHIVVAAQHVIIGYPTDLPKLSVVVNINQVPSNLYFRR